MTDNGSGPTYDIGKHRRRLWALAVIAILAATIWVLVGIRVVDIGRDLWALYGDAQRLRDSVADPAAALDMLPSIEEHVQSLFDHLESPIRMAERLAGAPIIGPTVGSLAYLGGAGESFSEFTFLMAHDSAEPAKEFLTGKSTVEETLPLLVGAWQTDAAALGAAAQEASGDLKRVASVESDRVVWPLRTIIERLQDVEPLLSAGLEAIPGLLRLTEQQGERVLLFLAQNSDELRATGGYISSFGILTLEDGMPTEFRLVDADRLEDWTKPHPDPPEPLREYMDIDLWVTRDANWWPDFARSARAVADLYTLNYDVPVDAVVAVDFAGAVRLLEVLAPLQLSDGQRLERGEIAEGLRGSWGLSEGALILDAHVLTATRAFVQVEVEISFCDKVGDVWFDSVSLEAAADPGVNLLQNASFEADADGDGFPDAWDPQGLSGADGMSAGIAHSGQSSLYMMGEPGVEKRMVQRIPYSGSAGDVFEYLGYSRTAGVFAKGGSYRLTIRLIGEDGEVEEWSENFASLTHDWATSGTASVIGEWWSGRKDFVSEAAGAAMRKILSQPQSVPWVDVLAEIVCLFDERHFQVFSDVDALQQVAVARGWAGGMGAAGADYLCVVDANMGYNKVSASVETSVQYRVDLTDGGRQARLTIDYVNMSPPQGGECDKHKQYAPDYQSLIHGCYWDYVRVYVPRGAVLLQGSGGDVPVTAEDDGAWTIYSTYFVLEPAGCRTITIEYMLPGDVVAEDVYSLTVRKQAGTDGIPLVVQVYADGPMAALTDLKAEQVPGGMSFATDLRLDRVFRVGLD